jgi:hypothetical protein
LTAENRRLWLVALPAPQPDQPCSIDECGKTARKAGLCWGHYKRRQRRQPVGVPLREQGTTELARLMLAFERYQEAESESLEKLLVESMGDEP